MNILLLLFGFLSGILGGMGMGGGTLLIPLLTFLDIPQTTIQAINLISFLPMAIVALGLHFKNGLVKTKNVLWIILPAIIFASLGAFLTRFVQPKILKYFFGALLLSLGIWQGVKSILSFIRSKKVDKIYNAQKQASKNRQKT